MHEKRTLNIIKTAINLSHVDKETKEWINLGLYSAEMVYTLEQASTKKRICDQARLHNLDRVIAFTLTIDGRQENALRLYGGDMVGFCRSLDLTLLTDDKISANLPYIERMVRQNGIVIYERK